MGMVLPMNYAEIEQEEMMYLDGGFDAKSFVYGALATAMSTFVGKAISRSLIGAAVRQAGWSLTLAINSLIVAAGMNPAVGVAIGAGVIAGLHVVGRRNGLW